MGAWITYGLGSLNENLPTFVVLPDARGFAPNGPANWSAGFLPAAHQGTMIRASSAEPDRRPVPAEASAATSRQASEADGLALLRRAEPRPHGGSATATRGSTRGSPRTSWRRKLQLSAPEVLDISGESAATRKLYGLDDKVTEDFGRNCLIARRLLERGVRFVQVWSGADNGFPRRNWDTHEDLARDHARDGQRAWTSPPRR